MRRAILPLAAGLVLVGLTGMLASEYPAEFSAVLFLGLAFAMHRLIWFRAAEDARREREERDR